MAKKGTTGAEKFITDDEGRRFLAVDGMIQFYGTYYKLVLDGGWGCNGCALNGKCVRLQSRFGDCSGEKRPDGNDVIFVDLGPQPWRGRQ